MIPKSVVVSRKRYDVHVGDAKRFKRANGYIDFVPANIYVHTNKRSKMQETFWHELTHAILHDMGHDLCDNERFVTAFANRLSDAVNSAKL